MPWSRLSALCASLALAAACSQKQYDLTGYRCDAHGFCEPGFVCHPLKNICVPAIRVDCSDDSAVCPSQVNTGDPCDAVGAYLPCADNTLGCDAGCRECQSDKTWSECPAPCDSVGTVENCSDCGDNCLTLPHVTAAICDSSGATPICKVTGCVSGYFDLDPELPGCECESHGSEVCDGVDDNCDGQKDNFPSAGAEKLACEAANPLAVNVVTWACDGTCVIVDCADNYWDHDGLVANGCEYHCTKAVSGTETCNGADDDCDGTADNMTPIQVSIDCNGKYPSAIRVTAWACTTGACHIQSCVAGYSDTNQSVADGCEAGCVKTSPETEVCDSKDNNCDGTTDNVDPAAANCSALGGTVYYRDEDGDGYGRTADYKCLCAAAAPYTATKLGDCDDDPTACGALCYPGRAVMDTCDGLDQNCSGADGEEDPAIVTSVPCDGLDSDLCLDDSYVACTAGHLVCGDESPTIDRTESAAKANCTDTFDNDCNGATDCCDAKCLTDAACTAVGSLVDQDGDGFAYKSGYGTTLGCDCDDTISACTTDCTTNTDSSGEPSPVVDCVEKFCGSDPASAASFCRVVNTFAELNAAITASNSRAGRDYILLNDNITINGTVAAITGTDGVTIHQRVGKTLTVQGDFLALNLAGSNCLIEGVNINFTAGNWSHHCIDIPGDNNTFRKVAITLTTNNNTDKCINIVGASNLIEDSSITHTGASTGGTDVFAGGDKNTLRRLAVTYASGAPTYAVSSAGKNNLFDTFTGTLAGGIGTSAFYISNADNTVRSATITTTGSGAPVIDVLGNNVTLDTIAITNSTAVYEFLRCRTCIGGSVSNFTGTWNAAANLVNYGIEASCTGTHFSNVSLVINNPAQNANCGVYANGVDNSFDTVSVDFKGTASWGVFVTPTASNNTFTNTTLKFAKNVSNVGFQIDGDGVNNAGAADVAVSGLSMTTLAGATVTTAGIRTYGLRSSFSNVAFTFGGNVTNYGLASNGDTTVIDHLTMSYDGNVGTGVYVNADANRVTNSVLTDNTPADGNGANVGIWVLANSASTGDSNVILNNQIWGFKQRGIAIDGSGVGGFQPEGNQIYRNLVTGGSTAPANDLAGIYLRYAMDTYVVNNVMAQNKMDGIQMDSCRSSLSDPARINYLDQNTIDSQNANADGIEFKGGQSVATCMRNNSFTNNPGAAVRVGVGFLNVWASSNNKCDLSSILPDGKWGNNQGNNGIQCDATNCNACACMPGGNANTFFEFSVNSPFVTTNLGNTDYYCLSSDVLVDAGSPLGPSLTSNPLYTVYDLNGPTTGAWNGSNPDIGGRERGVNGCLP